ncbi:MAG: hypothetical protein AB2A00_20165 [Myxococcota bacterium]
METGIKDGVSAFVVEATGGAVRTVLGLSAEGVIWLAMRHDNPLCQALVAEARARVVRADGKAFDALAQDVSEHVLAEQVRQQLHERLNGAAHRVFKMVLGPSLAVEQGLTMRT